MKTYAQRSLKELRLMQAISGVFFAIIAYIGFEYLILGEYGMATLHGLIAAINAHNYTEATKHVRALRRN